MRTTFDLPDDLMRRAKAFAALRGMKLRDLVADSIEECMRSPNNPAPRELPTFGKKAPRNQVPSRTNAEIEDELDSGKN